MELPALVEQHLGDEEPRSMLALGDEDMVVFTASRTLVYRGDSLLRDATVERYSHDIERLGVSAGRRKTTFVLESMTGTDQFSVPHNRAQEVLSHLLGGVLEAADILEEDESVKGVYRFSDLTIVVTDARLVKHVGTAIWDGDYTEFPYEALTGLTFEDGRVATQIVIRVEDGSERIKAPSDDAPLLRETLTEAVLAYHDAASLQELNDRLGPDTDDRPSVAASMIDENISPLIEREDTDPATSTQTGVAEPLDTSSTGNSSSRDELGRDASDPEASGFTFGSTEADESNLAAAVEALEEQVTAQQQRIEEQAERIEQLEAILESLDLE